MDKAWKQIFAAVIVGLLLPRVVLSAGLWLAGERSPGTEPTQIDTAAPTEQTQIIPVIPAYIPVLTGKADVAVMELESYVVGVVLAEMPASFETEALKAQAVVARTYALRRIEQGDRHPDGAVCTDSLCCQAYISEETYLQSRGTEEDILRIRQAVSDTRGEVLVYEGNVAEATYFSCSGGGPRKPLRYGAQSSLTCRQWTAPERRGRQAMKPVCSFPGRLFWMHWESSYPVSPKPGLETPPIPRAAVSRP